MTAALPSLFDIWHLVCEKSMVDHWSTIRNWPNRLGSKPRSVRSPDTRRERISSVPCLAIGVAAAKAGVTAHVF
jgi:hypothetical protein